MGPFHTIINLIFRRFIWQNKREVGPNPWNWKFHGSLWDKTNFILAYSFLIKWPQLFCTWKVRAIFARWQPKSRPFLLSKMLVQSKKIKFFRYSILPAAQLCGPVGRTQKYFRPKTVLLYSICPNVAWNISWLTFLPKFLERALNRDCEKRGKDMNLDVFSEKIAKMVKKLPAPSNLKKDLSKYYDL